MPTPKSDIEHRQFLEQLSALKVHFALRWCETHPGTSFSQALQERTFFVNLGAWHRGEIYDHPEVEGADRAAWKAFLDAADRVPPHSLEAEHEILALLPSGDQYFAPRVARDQAELHHPTKGLAARTGCLWLTREPGTLALPEQPGAPRVLEFHIANHRYPSSFLKEPGAVRGELRALALRALDLGFEALGTRSWLNDLPAWRDLFPPVWRERLTPRVEAVGGHLGCWGQVITARQTVSSHAEAYLRQHGEFELAMRASWMTVDEALGGILP